jgi:hypothetical protein
MLAAPAGGPDGAASRYLAAIEPATRRRMLAAPAGGPDGAASRYLAARSIPTS